MNVGSVARKYSFEDMILGVDVLIASRCEGFLRKQEGAIIISLPPWHGSNYLSGRRAQRPRTPS